MLLLAIFFLLGPSDIPKQKPVVVCPEYWGRNREIELSPFSVLDDLVPFSVESSITSETVNFQVSGYAEPQEFNQKAGFELFIIDQGKSSLAPEFFENQLGGKYTYKFSVRRDQVDGSFFVLSYKKPYLINLVEWLPPEEFFTASLKLVNREVEAGSDIKVEFTYGSPVSVDLLFGSTCLVRFIIYDAEGNRVMGHPDVCGATLTSEKILPGEFKTHKAAIKTERWNLVGRPSTENGKLQPGKYKIVGFLAEYRRFGLEDSTWVEIK